MATRDGARAALAALDERLLHYQLKAPAAGEVLDVLAKAGEVLQAGAGAVLWADAGAPYVDLFVPVPQLAGLVVGQQVAVQPDGDQGQYAGRIENISPTTEYTPRYLLSAEDRANLVTRVRVRLSDRDGHLHAGVPCKARPGAGP